MPVKKKSSIAHVDMVRRGIKAARGGMIYSLSQQLDHGSPHLCDAEGMSGSRFVIQQHVVRREEDNVAILADHVEFDTHSGTHIDALCHWSKEGMCHKRLAVDALHTESGALRLGLETVPSLVTRGVVIDVARLKGVDVLAAGEVISSQDLQGALDATGQHLEEGDIALIRTGWSRYWHDPELYMGSVPGLSAESASWLCDAGCIAIGADQWVVDAVPSLPGEEDLVCHSVCLVQNGVYLIENLYLEDVSDDSVQEMLIVVGVPKIAGASGFPVEVVAIA